MDKRLPPLSPMAHAAIGDFFILVPTIIIKNMIICILLLGIFLFELAFSTWEIEKSKILPTYLLQIVQH